MASAYAVGRARKDDAVGLVLGDLGSGQVAGENFGEEALAAEPSSDKLGVLRAVIENAEHGEGFLVFKSTGVVWCLGGDGDVVDVAFAQTEGGDATEPGFAP